MTEITKCGWGAGESGVFLWPAEVLVLSPRVLKLGAVDTPINLVLPGRNKNTRGSRSCLATQWTQGQLWLLKPNQRGRRGRGREERKETTTSSMTLSENYPVQLSFYRAKATVNQQQPWEILRQSRQERGTLGIVAFSVLSQKEETVGWKLKRWSWTCHCFLRIYVIDQSRGGERPST